MGSAHRVRVCGSVRVIIVTHGGWGWWGCLPPLLLSPQHVTENVWTTAKLHNWRWEIKSVPHGRWRELACWEQASISCSRQEEASHVFQRTVGARGMAAHRTALALLAIDIHLTAAAAGLVGSAASCCPGPRFRAAIPDSHPQPRQ